jgi:caspase domain-containing protein
MAKDDFAILTCISRYPNPGFKHLEGPPNDMELVEKWLLDPARGGFDPSGVNIKKVYTHKPYPQDENPAQFDPDQAPPTAEEFDLVFKKLLRKRTDMGPARVSGRLYLYFSGHGFCNRSLEKLAEAALYSANATRETYEHIFGTHYARVAVGWALFKEVVLIMDCCRDSEIARVPRPKPYRDTPDDSLAAEVQLLSIYAVPKGGKAQERAIPERNGKVHGLLTHALFRMLDELPPTSDGQFSSTDLRKHLLQSWVSICGDDAAPRPEVYPPPSGDIYFPASNKGSPFEFRWENQPPINASITLADAYFRDVAVFPLGAAGNQVLAVGSSVISHQRCPKGLKLRMKPGLYQFRVSGPAARTGIFKVEGSDAHVDL